MSLSIKARLQWTLNMVIVAITSMAALGMLLIVFWFENTLFYNHLQSDLIDHIHSNQAVEEATALPMRDTTYYKFPIYDDAILPEAFRGYPEGGHEVLLSAHAYNIFVRYQEGWGHVLVQDQSEFERYEQIVVATVIVGVLFIWIIGFIISRRLAMQILQPISKLANEVAQLQQMSHEQLSHDYPNDETGQLAKAFEHYMIRVNELLLREQQFSANASHELRTPMMVIRGAVDMIAAGEPVPAISKQLQRIDGALIQMQQQTELFLQLSRTPDSMAGNDQLEALDDIAKQQINYWIPFMHARGLSLTLEVIGNMPCLPKTSIVAVMNNLLRNAAQHTVNGGIAVVLTQTTLAVTDTGTGILLERLDKIKVRGAGAHPQGFGLGLAIVERICQRQGWYLTIEPNQPQGARVSINF